MFSVTTDTTKNRLYITLGDLSTDDITPIVGGLNQNISALKPGFTCMVDIREMVFEPGTKGQEYVEIVQGALADSGMGTVVRVVNTNNDHVHGWMEESSRSLGYSALLAHSIEEAEAILDKA
jgi:hypothetical protein